jgi:UDP-glucose 4-epimerase
MKQALVTGGAGFIGSHLVDRLLREGVRVVAVDDFSHGTRRNLQHVPSEAPLDILELDILDKPGLRQALRGADAVFHLAAFADLRRSLADREADLRVNLLGMINLLEAMEEAGVRSLLYASTSSLYGEAEVVPTPEDYGPVQTSLYGASKLAAEAFAEAHTQLRDLRLWTFRFSNVIGERCRRGVVWDFVRKLRENPRRLEILGDGNQSKEYLYISDCIDGMMTGFSRSSGRVNRFNLATETNLTPVDVANLVVKEMGLSHVQFEFSGGRSGWIGDNPIVNLDTSRLRALGWRPRVASEEAIARMARWANAECSRIDSSAGPASRIADALATD